MLESHSTIVTMDRAVRAVGELHILGVDLVEKCSSLEKEVARLNKVVQGGTAQITAMAEEKAKLKDRNMELEKRVDMWMQKAIKQDTDIEHLVAVIKKTNSSALVVNEALPGEEACADISSRTEAKDHWTDFVPCAACGGEGCSVCGDSGEVKKAAK